MMHWHRAVRECWPICVGTAAGYLGTLLGKSALSGRALAIGLVVGVLAWSVFRLRLSTAQQRQELELAQVVAHAIDQIFSIRAIPSDKLLYVSPACERLWGASAATLIKRPEAFFDMMHGEDRERARSEMVTGRRAGKAFSTEYRLIVPGLGERTISAGFFPAWNPDRRTGFWVCSARDVTDDRANAARTERNRRALRTLALVNAAVSQAQSREQLHLLACQAAVGDDRYGAAWIGLLEGGTTPRVRMTTHAGCAETWIADDAIDVASGGPVAMAVSTGRVVVTQADVVRCCRGSDPYHSKSGCFSATAMVPMVRDGQVFGLLALFSDDPAAFTGDELSLLEEAAASLAQGIIMIEAKAELARVRKMELIGQISGELSHDFNNILGIIASTAEIGGREALRTASRERFAAIATAALRGVDITRTLLGIARHPRGIARKVDLNDQITRMVPLLRAAVGPEVEVRLSLSDRPLLVEVDPAGFNNALINLAVNARDAMPQGGVLSLHARLAETTGAVHIEVRDTGAGMSDAVRGQAFEPFFSSKDHDRGTGLGLSVVRGFAEHHGGTALIAATGADGTIVRMVLPEMAANAQETGGAGRADRPAKTPLRVLLVDDEPDLAAALVETLTLAGHIATSCTSADCTMALLADQRFDVLVCDLLLQGEPAGGLLARRAAAIDPAMRIVLMSGNAGRHAEAGLNWPLLEKPFSAAHLIALVQQGQPAKIPAD